MVWLPGPTFDRSEDAMALRFAHLRWGDDSGTLRCPDCQASLWSVTDRPRVFGCSGCHCQRSVTAGTLLHGAKIRLWQIWALLVNLTQEHRPSARALACALGLHPETAWQWRHRILLGIASLPAKVGGHLHSASRRVPIRRPTHHAPPLPADASRALRHLCATRRFACVNLIGCPGEPWVAQVGYELARTLTEAIGYQPALIPSWAVDGARAVLDDIETHIRHVFHGVSARWLSRYAQFAAKRAWQPWSAESMCRRILGLPPATFDRLRPGTCATVDALVATTIDRPYCYLRPGYPQTDYVDGTSLLVS